jgi:hypothetical protein
MLRRGMQAVPGGQPNCLGERQGDTADSAERRWPDLASEHSDCRARLRQRNRGFLISRQLSRNDDSHCRVWIGRSWLPATLRHGATPLSGARGTVTAGDPVQRKGAACRIVRYQTTVTRRDTSRSTTLTWCNTGRRLPGLM